MSQITSNPDLVNRSPAIVPAPPVPDRQRPDPIKVGMICFLLSEVAFFGTLIMTFVFFLNQSTQTTPKPSEVFQLPLVLISTLCLLSSSLTITLAERSLHRGQRAAFLGWWGVTMVLGLVFLGGTGMEWADLIGQWKLTISRNLFGSTYFTLVGFHAAHVTVGLILLSIVFGLAVAKELPTGNTAGVTVVAWYWHFVDAVWIVVFTLVYVIARGMA